MDRKGFESITAALAAAEITATVVPVPEDGENFQFVTIETDRAAAFTLNALSAAALLPALGSRGLIGQQGPELKLLSIDNGAITFQDNKYKTARRQ